MPDNLYILTFDLGVIQPLDGMIMVSVCTGDLVEQHSYRISIADRV